MSKLNIEDVVSLVVFTIFLIGLGLAPLTDAKSLPITFMVMLWILILLGVFFGWWVTITTRQRQFRDAHPRARVWENNGITAVASEKDVALWREQYMRGVEAVIEPRDLRPAPKYTAFFTDNPEKARMLGQWYTGPMDEYRLVMTACCADRAELFVPRRERDLDAADLTPVTLSQLWRLIYGVEPPSDMNRS